MNPSLYWSVRRELWENRSIYIAPLVVACVSLFAFTISTIGMPQRRHATLLLDPARQRAVIAKPYDGVAMVLILTGCIVAIFYCLDALYGERRDRSILFWKSLPVSDVTTVLSKASVPMVILPSVVFVITVITHFLMLVWSSIVLLPSGLAGTTWTRFNLFTQSLILLYGLIAIALWHAPIYAWLLLVSAWAKRAAILWALLPWLLIGLFERIAFGTSYWGAMLKERLMGFASTAFQFNGPTVDTLRGLTPGRFLTTLGLWAGLLFAAIFIAAAVRVRHGRGTNE